MRRLVRVPVVVVVGVETAGAVAVSLVCVDTVRGGGFGFFLGGLAFALVFCAGGAGGGGGGGGGAGGGGGGGGGGAMVGVVSVVIGVVAVVAIEVATEVVVGLGSAAGADRVPTANPNAAIAAPRQM